MQQKPAKGQADFIYGGTFSNIEPETCASDVLDFITSTKPSSHNLSER